jgi:hypothetical protein
MSLVGSYWPVGATTLRLAPIRVFCCHFTNWGAAMAGAPFRFTEKRKTESKSPER